MQSDKLVITKNLANRTNVKIRYLMPIFYKNINSQLYATITKFIVNYNQLNMFRAIISPILKSSRLFLQLVVQCTGDAASRQ